MGARRPRPGRHVHAAHFDAATGVLDLRPTSLAWATHLRLRTAAIVQRIADHTGDRTVREIRILPPGPAPTSPRTTDDTAAALAEDTLAAAPEPGRREPSAGYRQAVAAHRAAVPEQRLAPGIRAAIERQDQALAWHREPKEAFRAFLVDQDQEAGQDDGRGRRASDAYTRALRRVRTEAAAQALPNIAAAVPSTPSAAQLRETA